VRKRALLLLVLVVALVVELAHYERGRSGPSDEGALVSRKEAQAQRALTLLDFWSQGVVSNLLLQRSRAGALEAGGDARAASLERRIRRGLIDIRDFAETAWRDPALRESGSAEVRALRAAGAAWSRYASELLKRPRSLHGRQARRIAALEANAVRLHQAAYDVVDASLRETLNLSASPP
jgi:hypothetical protein